MDSGNSGSMQSSSGGDEEYDSRAESISALLLSNTASHHQIGSSMATNNPHTHHNHHRHQPSSSSMFDPLSHFFDPLPPRQIPLSNPNSLLNLDLPWPKALRSDPNPIDLGGLIPPPSSSNPQPFSTAAPGTGGGGSNLPAVQISPESVPRGSVSGPPNEQNAVVRNPKKRSRASRRAPTTVLTTDTANFRAMVQEFTGIPAPPFTSSPFPRTRLDLFGSGHSVRSGGPLDPPHPPYLLRPFAHKINPPPPFSSASSSSMLLDGLVVSNSAPTSAADIGGSNSASLLNTNNNLLNPLLNLQSFLQTQQHHQKYPSSSIHGAAASDSSSKMVGVLQEFGLSHGNVDSQISGFQALSRSDNNPTAMTMMSNWGGGGDGVGSSNNDQTLLRSLNGSFSNNSERPVLVSNGKFNFSVSSSSSDFHGDKGTQNVTAARSEGMVESWICSSD